MDITEQVYYPSKDRSDSITTTYYAHIGQMPSTCSGKESGFFTLFANWDDFLGQYFLTAGKANERLVGGTTAGFRSTAGTPAKLLGSFRNFAPTLYDALADEASEVKAIQGLEVGHATINAMAITSADITSAKDKLIATCLAICIEISSTAHLAVWRRYLRTVWLRK